MAIDLTNYVFKIIEYDPTEKPRGVVTADEWNTIMHLLKESANYSAQALQDLFGDIYTASQLSSTEFGNDGSRLIGFDGSTLFGGADDVNAALRYLKEQMEGITLGSIADGSLTSEKLASDINLTGVPTVNNSPILTSGDIDTVVNASSTDTRVPSSKCVYNLSIGKQDIITYGTTVPNNSTPGNIYLQYFN